MRQQRGAIGPLLEKHQSQRVFAIDMHGVRDAARLGARTMDVFEAQFADFVKTVRPRRDAAGDHDHSIPRFRRRQGAELLAPRSIGCCGQRFNAARPASVST
jgi:hypothetical protein